MTMMMMMMMMMKMVMKMVMKDTKIKILTALYRYTYSNMSLLRLTRRSSSTSNITNSISSIINSTSSVRCGGGVSCRWKSTMSSNSDSVAIQSEVGLLYY